MDNEIKSQLADTIRFYNSKGWSPATSSNYSFKDESGSLWVSKSGIDKSKFQAIDFITVDGVGRSIGAYEGIKPSAETLIHCVLYELFPDTTVILHSHSVFPILISTINKESVTFEGYEIQKGFEGQTTHENSVQIPIFENTQDMDEFKKILLLNKDRIQNHSFVMRKHGTYAWGKNLFEAKRHLETLEYLCQCEWMLCKNS